MTDMDMHGQWRIHREFDEFMRYNYENAFQLLDEASRRTGKMVKRARAYSSRGFRLRDMSMKFLQHDAEQQSLTQDLYPQTLGQQLFCDLPKFIRWVWVHVVAPLTPERTRQKTCIVDTSYAADCERLDAHIATVHRPAWLGGTSTKEWPPSFLWEEVVLRPIGLGVFRRYDEPGYVHPAPNVKSE